LAKKKSATTPQPQAGSRKTSSSSKGNSPAKTTAKKSSSKAAPSKRISRVPEAFALGTKAVTRSDWDAAIEAFRQAVNNDPANLLYRQKLRSATCAKYRNNQVGDKNCHIAMVRLTVELRRAQQHGDAALAEQICEDALAYNPWNADFLLALAEANLLRKHSDVARFSISLATQCAEDRPEIIAAAKQLLAKVDMQAQ
jgi:tetratricopeptide (TPR) repeat protein